MFYPRFCHDWLVMRQFYLCLNIAFMMSYNLANEFPNLVCYVYYWTFVGRKKGWRAVQYENHGNTWKATQFSWICANIYKLVRQYFAPCLFNQETVAAIFYLVIQMLKQMPIYCPKQFVLNLYKNKKACFIKAFVRQYFATCLFNQKAVIAIFQYSNLSAETNPL